MKKIAVFLLSFITLLSCEKADDNLVRTAWQGNGAQWNIEKQQWNSETVKYFYFKTENRGYFVTYKRSVWRNIEGEPYHDYPLRDTIRIHGITYGNAYPDILYQYATPSPMTFIAEGNNSDIKKRL